MKKIYATLLFVVSCLVASAQVSIAPNPSINNDFEFTDFEAVGYTTVTNGASEAVDFTWTRNIVEMTEGWQCAICDINLCYMASVSTQTFELPAGGSGNLDVHIYPSGIEGGAIVELTVVDNGNPDNTETGVYFFNQLVNTTERLNERIKVFPNPVQDFLNIEAGYDVARIEIFSLEGRLIHAELLNGNSALNVSELATGTYVLRMFDADNKALSGNVLIKE